jgi:hypothetical protein
VSSHKCEKCNHLPSIPEPCILCFKSDGIFITFLLRPVQVTLISPQEYYGDMVEVVKERRGADLEVQYLDDGSVLLTSLIPWQEVVCEMNDQVVELVSESICLRFCPPTRVRLSTHGYAITPNLRTQVHQRPS